MNNTKEEKSDITISKSNKSISHMQRCDIRQPSKQTCKQVNENFENIKE